MLRACAHVILLQRTESKRCAHLVHWDAWPLLRKFRAVLFAEHNTVTDIMTKVRVDGNALRDNARYRLAYTDEAETQYLAFDDRVQVANSIVLYGSITYRYPEYLSDSDVSNTSRASNSTRASSASTDMDEDDRVSWVSTAALMQSFDDRGPYPWELEDYDQEILEDADEELEEPSPTLHVAPEDLHQLTQHANILRVAQPQTDQPWVATDTTVNLRHMSWTPCPPT